MAQWSPSGWSCLDLIGCLCEELQKRLIDKKQIGRAVWHAHPESAQKFRTHGDTAPAEGEFKRDSLHWTLSLRLNHLKISVAGTDEALSIYIYVSPSISVSICVSR